MVWSCNLSYNELKDFMSRKSSLDCITINSCIEMFALNFSTMSFAEWMVHLNINKGIVIDFEWHSLHDQDSECNETVMLKKDLHTDEVLYERESGWKSRADKAIRQFLL